MRQARVPIREPALCRLRHDSEQATGGGLFRVDIDSAGFTRTDVNAMERRSNERAVRVSRWGVIRIGYNWVTARAGQLAWLWSCGQVAYRIVSDGGFTYEVRVGGGEVS
jgi:hypothetical protein